MSGPRVLFVSGSIGLGHAARDLAIAGELRRLDPRIQIDWLAGEPARRLIEEAGEDVLPEAAAFGESDFAERTAAGFSLNIVWRVEFERSPPRGAGGARMNKSQLVSAVADQTGFTRADAGRAVDATLAAIERALQSGEDVALTGFGRFSVAERAARRGINPATGERIRIKASRSPKFTSGARLRAAVARKPRARRGSKT